MGGVRVRIIPPRHGEGLALIRRGHASPSTALRAVHEQVALCAAQGWIVRGAVHRLIPVPGRIYA